MKRMQRHGSSQGFTLVELMVAIAAGLILIAGMLAMYAAQGQTYASAGAQGSIQEEESAISALVIPALRSAGFAGCSSFALAESNLNGNGPPPLGTLNAARSTVYGYDYTGTGGGGTYTIAADNAANDANATDWSPTLDGSLTSDAAAGSDVLTVLGGVPQTQPVGVTAIAPSASNLTIYSNPASVTAGQFGAVSDCAKAIVFQVTNVASAGSNAVISHAAGTGSQANQSASLPVNFQPGAQFIPLQQTAFFVAQGPGNESVLMRATLQGPAGGSATWVIQPLVPGVENMQVLYGVGANGVATQYLPASAVANWAFVDTVRIAFLLEGQPGSAGLSRPTTFSLLGTTVTVPADSRLRHVFEITVNLRNA
jgi:type IV pilus assembly protein PilW